MSLIKSISGIRGTIGGLPGQSLTPLDVVKYAGAFGQLLLNKKQAPKVVIGRDARLSGPMVSALVVQTLNALGISVVDLELSTTPTVEMAVVYEQAGGGIIITASHNPGQWNALKLLNNKGEFISAADGAEVLRIADANEISFAQIKNFGTHQINNSYLQKHINAILELPLVDKVAIKKKKFSIAVDGISSTGGIAVPMLLSALGIEKIECIDCEPTGYFAHNPEPLPENLTHIAGVVKNHDFDLGIVVDPDVDRLCFITEDGEMFGEEYTLVAVADYVLSQTPGNTVSNLSSTRALADVTIKHGGKYSASAVGEVNVVEKMKETQAVIGGEGNGGIIYPELHYGRDALVGIALFLTYLAKSKKSASALRKSFPNYHISKNKIDLEPNLDLDAVILEISKKYDKYPHNSIDGLRIDIDDTWVHLRKSNTEPIIRIYSEAPSQTVADNLANKIISDIKDIIKTMAK